MTGSSFHGRRERVSGQRATLTVSRWLTSQFARILKGVPEEARDTGQRDEGSPGNPQNEGVHGDITHVPQGGGLWLQAPFMGTGGSGRCRGPALCSQGDLRLGPPPPRGPCRDSTGLSGLPRSPSPTHPCPGHIALPAPTHLPGGGLAFQRLMAPVFQAVAAPSSPGDAPDPVGPAGLESSQVSAHGPADGGILPGASVQVSPARRPLAACPGRAELANTGHEKGPGDPWATMTSAVPGLLGPLRPSCHKGTSDETPQAGAPAQAAVGATWGIEKS